MLSQEGDPPGRTVERAKAASFRRPAAALRVIVSGGRRKTKRACAGQECAPCAASRSARSGSPEAFLTLNTSLKKKKRTLKHDYFILAPCHRFPVVNTLIATRAETCSSERAGAGGAAAAAAAAAGAGVAPLTSLPGQLWVLTPRLRGPARGGALAGGAHGSVRGMLTGQERVRACPLWPPGWHTRLPTVSTGDRWRLSQRSTRSSLYLMEYQVRKMKKKPKHLRLAARPK
ncbi:hypothetical protein EYF80_051516 [Liparis tanakae]|uniref:Uncharacterized protein n=1 Tax=Liparis tanakae TaxID=230148 RepID=A0A4Z2FBM3_9TELE|nr:hypothetical protein EYF80_051516 [Liparis tanakae]